MLEASTIQSRPAAQYVRMSTDRQDFSIEMQSLAIAEYAEKHGYEVVQTYSDAGISGLDISNRPALRSLLADVVGGTARYATVLVYDISRWGRFQNPDQAAHYEFICVEAGIPVHYCAEPFANDGSPTSGLLKSMKRLMAAEFSRELAHKTKAAKEGLRDLGYWTNGAPGYGLRRQAVTRSGRTLRVCQYGERNPHLKSRCVLVHGPADEVATVRRIYRLYIQDQLSFAEIATHLNRDGLKAENGRDWRWYTVRQIITNEKYAGTYVGARFPQHLGKPLPTTPEDWVRLPGFVKPIVTKATFESAQREYLRRRRVPTNEDLMAEIHALYQKHGFVSQALISAYSGRTSAYYRRRLGDLQTHFAQAGFKMTKRQQTSLVNMQAITERRREKGCVLSDEHIIRKLRGLLAVEGRLTIPLILSTPGVPTPATIRRRFGNLKAAYAMAGYVPSARQAALMHNGPSAAMADVG